LAHGRRSHAKTSSNVFNAHPLIYQTAKRIKLIGRVHSGANYILRQTRFGASFSIYDSTGHAETFRNPLFFGQFGKCGEATGAGDDLVFVSLWGLGHNEIMDQAVCFDRGREVLDCQSSGLSDVKRRDSEFAQRYANDFESCIHKVFSLVNLGKRGFESGFPSVRGLGLESPFP
jgi:hypothetical protein